VGRFWSAGGERRSRRGLDSVAAASHEEEHRDRGRVSPRRFAIQFCRHRSRMVHWVSDSEDSDKFEWDTDGEDAGSFNAAASGSSALASRNFDAPGPSTKVANANGTAWPSASSVQKYVDMGFPEEMVLKAMKDNGDNSADSLIELLLTYQAIGNDPSVDMGSASRCVPQAAKDSDDDDDLENWDDNDDLEGPTFDESSDEDFLHEMSQVDEKVNYLVKVLGFPEGEVTMAVTRCGMLSLTSVSLRFFSKTSKFFFQKPHF